MNILHSMDMFFFAYGLHLDWHAIQPKTWQTHCYAQSVDFGVSLVCLFANAYSDVQFVSNLSD
jgi:hypothetical protein